MTAVATRADDLDMAPRLLRFCAFVGLAALCAVPAVASAGSRPEAAQGDPSAAAAGLSGASLDSSHVKLQWGAVRKASRYKVLRDGLLIGTTTATAYTDALLWPQTGYSYEVDAVSAQGGTLKTQTAKVTTATLPAAGFPRPFGATSVWNSPVGSIAPAAGATGLLSYFQAHALNPNMPLHAWGVAVAEAHADDSTYSVPCTFYVNCTLGAFGAFRIPLTAAPDPSPDGHLAVVDPSSQREWDMWQAKWNGASWSASAGAAVSTTGDGVAPDGTESGDAANFPLRGGLVRPEEILQGHIDHALVFGLPGVSKLGHVCPATHNDGSSTDPNALEEGTRLQLDPSVNVDALPIQTWQKTIARALQVYGMYLRDSSGSLAIWAENPIARGYDAWAKVGLSGDSVSLAGIPWGKMRVLPAPC